MNLWMCFLISVLGGVWVDVLAQSKKCPSLKLKNGRVRIRGGGRMAYFRCKRGFKRVGHKLAVCLSSGTWSQQIPVCVGRGCPDLGTLPDVTVTEMYKGGILQFTCPEGMRREGPQKLMCDGTSWDNQPPKCLYGVSPGCDFEDSGLCGWSQDANDDFDWTWTSGFTPTSDTGPDHDHTTGSGHYIFMESSAPQKSGQVTRLISPPYQPTPDDMCVEFFYHMKGPQKEQGKAEVGDLDVFIRTSGDGQPTDVAVFHRDGYQDNDWIRGIVAIPEQQQVYRIVFAATRRESWNGDIALDDIRVFNCSDMPETTMAEPTSTTTIPPTTTTTTTTPTTTTTATTTTTTTTRTTTPTTTTTTSTTTPTTTTTTTTTEPSTSTSTTTQPSTSSTTTTTTSTTTEPATTPESTTATSAMTTPDQNAFTTTTGDVSMTYTTMTRPTYFPTVEPFSTEMKALSTGTATTPKEGTQFSSSTSLPYSHTPTTEIADGSGSSEKDDSNSDDDKLKSTPSSTTTGKDKPKGGNQRSSESGGGVQDYLPLIVGVSLGLAVGMGVVGVLAWLWARNRRKQKEIQIEEDQLNIIGSIEGNSYSYPPSGSEH